MGDYSFGFNGKDKESEFNSGAYDFGARIFDARLGRWMSVDKASHSQPNWSTYKAYKDSPIIYCDPDGNTEFLTIVIKDMHGHKMEMTIQKSENVMTDGVVKKTVYFMFGQPWIESHSFDYYDFKTTITYTIDDNGKLLSTARKVDIIKTNGVKDNDLSTTFGDPVKAGDVKDPDGFNEELDFQESGIHCTSEDGGSDPLRQQNNGGASRDIGDFLTAVSGFMKDPKSMPNIRAALGPAEFISLVTELQSEIEKLNSAKSESKAKAKPQLGDSVIVKTTKITNHTSTYNGQKVGRQSHSSGPDMKGVIPKDTVGGVFKGDQTLKVDFIEPIKR